MVNDLQYLGFSQPMSIAIAEALKVNPYPNPRVGAVLTDKKGKIKAISKHVKKGSNHAEINIFEQVKPESSDVLYITLEPCFHSDTSPSCASEIIKQGIKHVVIGDIDLDIRTNGKSVQMLKAKNITVRIEKNANNLLNPHYKNLHSNLKEINYLLKIGISKNNFITDNSSKSKYITNEVSLKLSHFLRASADCIVIGKNTLLSDKPKLNVRLQEIKNSKHIPAPIVLWGRSSKNLSEAQREFPNFTFLSDSPTQDNNIKCSTYSIDEIESFFLNKNFRNVFIEGGNSVIDLFLKQNKIDTIYEFRSQKNIDSGLKISQAYLDNVKNDFSISNEYQLLDNSLTTYTKD